MFPFYEREIKKKKGTPCLKQVQKLAGKFHMNLRFKNNPVWSDVLSSRTQQGSPTRAAVLPLALGREL
jgi:hypothetical protein